MKKSCIVALTLALLMAVGGCGGGVGNLGSTPQETSKLQMDNLKEIKTTLETIQDDATASAALPKLEKSVARQNALKKKMDSYSLSIDDGLKLMKENASEMMSTGMALALVQLQAVQKAPGKAADIQAVMQKMSDGQGNMSFGGPNSTSGPVGGSSGGIHGGKKRH
jgi:hypothetical protein